MNADDTLDVWIREVNTLGTESAITLMVSGTTLTGFITPAARYLAWMEEISSRATFGERALPRSEIGPISDRQSALLRQAWAEMEQAGKTDATLNQLCLRDVTIMAPGPRADWPRVPFLVIKRSAIDAHSPILVST